MYDGWSGWEMYNGWETYNGWVVGVSIHKCMNVWLGS